MADTTTQNDAINQLKALLGDGAEGLVDQLASALATKVDSKVRPKYPTSSKADEMVHESEYAFAKGRTYISVEVIKAIAGALKNDEVSIVEAPEELRNVDAFVIFRTESGVVSVQNLYVPK